MGLGERYQEVFGEYGGCVRRFWALHALFWTGWCFDGFFLQVYPNNGRRARAARKGPQICTVLKGRDDLAALVHVLMRCSPWQQPVNTLTLQGEGHVVLLVHMIPGFA